jgi:Ca2+-binding RTX toxin-like protein
LVLLGGAGPASAANRFAEVGGNGPSATCPLSDPCSIEDAINIASGASMDDVTLLGGLPPAPYTTSTALVVPSNVTVHGTVGARPVIETDTFSGPGVKLNVGSVLRDVVVDYSGANEAAILLDGGGTLERVTARASGGSSDGGCGTVNGGTPVIRDSVCWHDGPATPNPVGGVTARNDSVNPQTLTLRNVTAISSDNNNEAGIFAIRSSGGALTVNATNVIAFSELGSDVAHLAGFTPTAVNLDHSNYDSETDPSNVITSPGTGSPNFNQTSAPVFVNRLGGDFHQLSTSAGTIDLGTATGLLMGELDFDGQPRTIGALPDIGADELRHPTTTAVSCVPTSVLTGSPTTCTATVTDTPTSGIATPTGNVSFSSDTSGGSFGSGGTCTLTTLNSAQASCPLTYTPGQVGTGTHQVSGAYSGDSNHAASAGSTPVTVSAPPEVPGGGAAPPMLAECAGKQVTIAGSRARISGTAGNDTIVGTPAADVIDGAGGNDNIRGGGGNDTICGDEGKDTLRGGAGNDKLLGGAGADVLKGGPGKDKLKGGAGADVLKGGPGKDKLKGGPGKDTQVQ